MSYPTHPRIEAIGRVADGLIYVARELARAAAAKFPRTQRGRNATLRPGPATPTWNALVEAALPLLKKRGAKANLARELGVPRQRLTEFFVTRSAAPDAEHALLLLLWVGSRQAQASRALGASKSAA